ncbi:MAG: AAA family ATPase [Nanoarchaeota archaeon]|nr:AAA family ATPase [Nanoarchaeota archaeon]
MPFERIYVLGTCGSGKSYLARELSEILGIKHYDLDDIFWERKFGKKRDKKERLKLFRKLCNKKKWIVEGAYSVWIDYGIKKSDLVIVLDTKIPVSLWRIIKRTIKREKSKKLGKDRYNESWQDLIGLIKAVLKYKKKKGYGRGYHKQREIIKKHNAEFIHIKNKRQLKCFLKELEKLQNIH